MVQLATWIFQVKDVIDPPPAEGLAKTQLRQQLAQSVATDNLSQYIAGVRTDLGAEINQRTFSALAGTGDAVN